MPAILLATSVARGSPATSRTTVTFLAKDRVARASDLRQRFVSSCFWRSAAPMKRAFSSAAERGTPRGHSCLESGSEASERKVASQPFHSDSTSGDQGGGSGLHALPAQLRSNDTVLCAQRRSS
jgi:hypothetical protein